MLYCTFFFEKGDVLRIICIFAPYLYIYIMTQQFEMIAKTFMGLEPVLAKELTQLGANNVQQGRRMVSFTGDKEMMYRANFQLHTAIRILKPIKHFICRGLCSIF